MLGLGMPFPDETTFTHAKRWNITSNSMSRGGFARCTHLPKVRALTFHRLHVSPLQVHREPVGGFGSDLQIFTPKFLRPAVLLRCARAVAQV